MRGLPLSFFKATDCLKLRGLTLTLLLIAAAAAADPCSDEEAETLTRCRTAVACAWTYAYTASDGKKHDRSWCYGSAADAQKAFDARVKLADQVARSFDEASEAPSLLRVYCDACGDPKKRSAVKKLGKGAFGRWWYQANDKIKDAITSILKQRLMPGPIGAAGFWLYKMQDQLKDLNDQAALVAAEVAEWPEGGLLEIDENLARLGDELRDDAAKIDASRVAAPIGMPTLPVIEVPDRSFMPPAINPTVQDGNALLKELRYSLRLGFDNRFHLVFANRGDAPRRITFKTQHSEPQMLEVPPHGAQVAVVSHTQAVLLPVCNPLDWGPGCGVEILSSECVSGEVRNEKGVCAPDCPPGLLVRRTPKGARCECPAKKTWDAEAKACRGANDCPPGMVAQKTSAGTNCVCPAGKRYEPGSKGCVDDTCLGGARFDLGSGRCACPVGLGWSKPDQRCIAVACTGGTLFDSDQGRCVCPSSFEWNAAARACQCPGGTFLGAGHCVRPSCGANQSFDWNSRSCVCVSPMVLGSGGTCACANAGEVLFNGVCKRMAVDASGAVTARTVLLTVRDHNAALDDGYLLYVNDVYIGEINNPPGGSSQVNINLSSGENLIELRLRIVKGNGTLLELSLEPGGFVKQFQGTRNHSYLIRAP